MRVYISGKITSTTDYIKRFRIAQNNIADMGHQVINPADICSRLPSLDPPEYMSICIPLLNLCDAIYMLNGWEESIGAKTEYGHALMNGIKIMTEADRSTWT